MAMAKAKKRLSKALAAVFTAFTLLSMAPAALAAGPINENKPTVKAGADLQINAQTKAEYKIGERIDFYVQAPNVAGLVEYRVAVWSKMTGMRDLFQDKASKAKGYWYQPWKTAGTYERRITWVASGDNWPEGDYQLVAYVRRNGQTKFEDVEEVGTFKLVKDAPVAEATVESVANPADATVNVGDKFTAPTTVKATMSDKTTKDVAVTWENTVDTSKAGDVTLTGKAADKAVSMKVSVKEVALKVDSIAAKTASTFEVKFNRAVADTSKVAFDVKREGTAYAMTASWNADKTVATLTGSAKFPLGNYSVNVKEDTKDLGTKELKIEQEKVAKIVVTSDTLAVVSNVGYFTYKVENQYGDDITNSSLPSINWTVGGGTAAASKGTVTVTPASGIQLLSLPSLVVTAIDSNANVVSSANLKISFTNSTLSDIKLNALKQADGKEFIANETSVKFTIDFEAKDMGGNVTTDYDLINSGLNTLTISPSDYATVTLVKGDNNKATIEVQAKAKAASIDMPVLVTAITKNGKSSTLNLTLKKQAEVNTVTLMQPAVDVAYGDDPVEIPFAAYDQNGNQVTKWDDLVTNNITGKNFTLSSQYDGTTGMKFMKRADGTAKLVYVPETSGSEKTVVLSVSTQTGKFSQISINVRKAAVASSLSIDTSKITAKLQQGASLDVDSDAFIVKDQYGRKMDLKANKAEVRAYVTSGLTTNNGVAVDKATDSITLSAGTGASDKGTFGVKFALTTSNVGAEIDAKTVDFRLLEDKDIKGIALDGVAKLYNPGASPATSVQTAYDLDIDVYGKDADGNFVILKGQNFQVTTSNADTVATGASNSVNVYVNKNMATSATQTTNTVLSVTTVINGEVMTASGNIESSTETPVAKSITMADEVLSTSTKSIASAFSVTDQYDVDMLNRCDSSVTVYVNKGGVVSTLTPANYKVTTISSLTLSAGDTITIVSNNGLTKTAVIK